MNNWIVGVGIMRPGPSERKWSRFHAFNSMHSTLSTRRSDPGGGRPACRDIRTFGATLPDTATDTVANRTRCNPSPVTSNRHRRKPSACKAVRRNFTWSSVTAAARSGQFGRVTREYMPPEGCKSGTSAASVSTRSSVTPKPKPSSCHYLASINDKLYVRAM